jgi:hypothetical protein
MIVYVETNFCLELAFQQEEEAQAEEILQLAGAGRYESVFPQFAVCEPFSTLNRYDNERRRFFNDLNRQLSVTFYFAGKDEEAHSPGLAVGHRYSNAEESDGVA